MRLRHPVMRSVIREIPEDQVAECVARGWVVVDEVPVEHDNEGDPEPE